MKKFIQLKTLPNEDNYYEKIDFINIDYIREVSFQRLGEEEYIEIYVDGDENARRVDVRHDSEWALNLIRWLEENRYDQAPR